MRSRITGSQPFIEKFSICKVVEKNLVKWQVHKNSNTANQFWNVKECLRITGSQSFIRKKIANFRDFFEPIVFL